MGGKSGMSGEGLNPAAKASDRRASVLPRQWFQSLEALYPLARPYADFVFRTCREEVLHAGRLASLVNGGQPVIFCQWHGRFLALVGSSRRYGDRSSFWPKGAELTAVASLDAEKMLDLLGIPTIPIMPGAVSGADVRRIVAAIRRGSSLNVSLDGPIGPFRCAALGIIRIAQITGAPLMPIGFSQSTRFHLNTWDRLLVPLPFQRMIYFCGEPMFVASNSKAADLEEARSEIERRLSQATDLADAAAAIRPANLANSVQAGN